MVAGALGGVIRSSTTWLREERLDTTGKKAQSRANTRAAILAAARQHFSSASYEQVGMRAIAATAGVNLALINRYFGTKANLFREMMTASGLSAQFSDTLDAIPEKLARYMVESSDQGAGEEQLMALLRSVQNEQAAEVLRELVEAQVRPLAEQLEGPDAHAKAELAIAVLIGAGIARHVLRTEHLASLDPQAMQALVVPVFMACLSNRS